MARALAVGTAASTLALSGTGCQPGLVRTAPPRWSGDLATPALAADSTHVDTIARGVLHRFYRMRSGPWAVHVLDVDRAACWTAVAAKGASGAVGRLRTSDLAASLSSPGSSSAASPAVAGAVNADFFRFTPPGVPVGAMIHEGRLITGPVDRPVFAIDSTGRPWLGTLRADGQATAGAEALAITGWNRHMPAGLALFDESYGPAVDTAGGTVRVTLEGPRGGSVIAIDTSAGPTVIRRGGAVLVLGANAPADARATLLLLARARGRFDVRLRLVPFHPTEAVGGFPLLVRDSIELPGLDSAGAANFAPVRHPRTLVALGAGGRRLQLITIDGRQPDHSAGMTLREAAQLALSLGATDALNLDGGGSTAMVVARRTGGTWRHQVANRPSDPQGERAVGNALLIQAC